MGPRRSPESRGIAPLLQAFDEARFGARGTLNLRAELPTVEQARERCERWLRQVQIEGQREVLVITGRGHGSDGGVSPVREAIAALLPSLRRRNVVRAFREHTAGSFVVELAPVRALFEAPRRRREPPAPPPPVNPALRALEPETIGLLEELAALQLAALGLRDAARPLVEDEMLRQFIALSPAVGDGDDAEARLQQALVRAIEEAEAL
jgi:hypothetical protein